MVLSCRYSGHQLVSLLARSGTARFTSWPGAWDGPRRHGQAVPTHPYQARPYAPSEAVPGRRGRGPGRTGRVQRSSARRQGAAEGVPTQPCPGPPPHGATISAAVADGRSPPGTLGR